MSGSNFNNNEKQGRITDHGWVPDSLVYRRRKGKLQALSKILSPVNRRAFGKRSPVEAELISGWNVVVGEELAAISNPIEMQFPNKRERLNGRLVLAVKSGRGLEIQHREPQLIEKINRFLGYRAIGRIQIKQGLLPVISRDNETTGRLSDEIESVSELELKEAGYEINQIEDSDLREALNGWIGVLAARNKKKDDSKK